MRDEHLFCISIGNQRSCVEHRRNITVRLANNLIYDTNCNRLFTFLISAVIYKRITNNLDVIISCQFVYATNLFKNPLNSNQKLNLIFRTVACSLQTEQEGERVQSLLENYINSHSYIIVQKNGNIVCRDDSCLTKIGAI